MTSSMGIEPGPHWWEASALTKGSNFRNVHCLTRNIKHNPSRSAMECGPFVFLVLHIFETVIARLDRSGSIIAIEFIA